MKATPQHLPSASPMGTGTAGHWCTHHAAPCSTWEVLEPWVPGPGLVLSRVRTQAGVQGCLAPNHNTACRLGGATTQREKKYQKKHKKKGFWEFIWFKTKSLSWNHKEERLSRLIEVLHMGYWNQSKRKNPLWNQVGTAPACGNRWQRKVSQRRS